MFRPWQRKISHHYSAVQLTLYLNGFWAAQKMPIWRFSKPQSRTKDFNENAFDTMVEGNPSIVKEVNKSKQNFYWSQNELHIAHCANNAKKKAMRAMLMNHRMKTINLIYFECPNTLSAQRK